MFSCEYCETFKNTFMIEHLRRLSLKTSGVFRTKFFENTVTYIIIKLFTQTSILTSKTAVETLNIFIKQLLDIWLFFCYSVTFHSKHSCDVIDSQVVQHTLLMTHNGNLDWQFFLVLLMNKNNINAKAYYIHYCAIFLCRNSTSICLPGFSTKIIMPRNLFYFLTQRRYTFIMCGVIYVTNFPNICDTPVTNTIK